MADPASPAGGTTLVTGGTGFVGTRIVHALRAEGRPVRVLVRRAGQASTLAAWGCELVEGDVRDPDALGRAVAGCERVIHLVAIITGTPSDFETVMTEPTRTLSSLAPDAGVSQFILMSALGTSERSKDLVPYYRAKWEMEQAVRASGVDFTIFRPSFIFGRGGILPTFLRQVRYLPVIPIPGSGERRLAPIWVEDVAAFFARALGASAAAGRTFDLCGPDRPTWNEFYDQLARRLGKRRGKLHIPMPLMRANAALLELLPRPPLTRDQLTMLEFEDNVGDAGPAIETFGIEPISLEEQLRHALST